MVRTRNRPTCRTVLSVPTTHCWAIHNCPTPMVYLVSIEMMVSPSKILTYEWLLQHLFMPYSIVWTDNTYICTLLTPVPSGYKCSNRCNQKYRQRIAFELAHHVRAVINSLWPWMSSYSISKCIFFCCLINSKTIDTIEPVSLLGIHTQYLLSVLKITAIRYFLSLVLWWQLILCLKQKCLWIKIGQQKPMHWALTVIQTNVFFIMLIALSHLLHSPYLDIFFRLRQRILLCFWLFTTGDKSDQYWFFFQNNFFFQSIYLTFWQW